MFEATLSQVAKKSLATLGQAKLLKETYLASGSALALSLGHCHSLDFDFFTPKRFDSRKIAANLKKLGKFEKTKFSTIRSWELSTPSSSAFFTTITP